jgi:hypothetical protein
MIQQSQNSIISLEDSTVSIKGKMDGKDNENETELLNKSLDKIDKK